ncbi:MAG TPA: CVNH domain-containing protein, partial [Candidatus Angelobacter sp.]|nr:CVNH domain-containing protein [Candidatus Angelobacter sp.]
MRYRTGLIFTLALLALVFMATAASAQQAPYGSYQQTCRHIEVRGSVLYAECKDADNHWRSTSLGDYQYCRGEIQNIGGNLQCSDAGNPGYPGNPDYSGQYPPGSYQQTCRNIGVSGNVLYAECQDVNGNWRQTQLNDYQRCRGDIQNLNSGLQCSNAGYPGGPGYPGNPGYPGGPNYSGLPYGSYQQTCRNIGVRGNVLYAECQDVNQYWQSTQLANYRRCGEIQNL